MNPINDFSVDASAFGRRFEALGHGAGQAKWPALVEISRMATRQARFLSPLDGFWFATGVAPYGAALAIWQKRAD